MNLAKEKIEPVRCGAICGSLLIVTVDWMDWVGEGSLSTPGFCKSHPPRACCDCRDLS